MDADLNTKSTNPHINKKLVGLKFSCPNCDVALTLDVNDHRVKAASITICDYEPNNPDHNRKRTIKCKVCNEKIPIYLCYDTHPLLMTED